MIPALIGAGGALLGGYLNRRESRRHYQRESLTGRVRQAQALGINKLVAVGSQPAGFTGGAFGAGVASAADNIAQGFRARQSQNEQDRAFMRQMILNQLQLQGMRTLERDRATYEAQRDARSIKDLESRLRVQDDYMRESQRGVKGFFKDMNDWIEEMRQGLKRLPDVDERHNPRTHPNTGVPIPRS